MISPARPLRASRPLAVASVLGVLALAACADGTEPGTTDPTPTATSAPSPTTTPTPTPTATSPTPTPSPTGTGHIVEGRLWITTPVDGETVTGPEVTVTGEGTAFEANLLWQVVDDAGVTVAEDFTMAGANGEIGPYSFTVSLDPGTYTIEVWEPDMSDGAAGTPPPHVQVGITVE